MESVTSWTSRYDVMGDVRVWLPGITREAERRGFSGGINVYSIGQLWESSVKLQF